jgi:hypothetical protein
MYDILPLTNSTLLTADMILLYIFRIEEEDNQESWTKQEASNTLMAFVCSGSLLRFFLDSEDGCDIFLRNVGQLSTTYIVLYSRTQNYS